MIKIIPVILCITALSASLQVSGQDTIQHFNPVKFPTQRYEERLLDKSVGYFITEKQIKDVKTFSDLFYFVYPDSSLFCAVTYAPLTGNAVTDSARSDAFSGDILNYFQTCRHGDVFIFKMYRQLSDNTKQFTGPFVQMKVTE